VRISDDGAVEPAPAIGYRIFVYFSCIGTGAFAQSSGPLAAAKAGIMPQEPTAEQLLAGVARHDEAKLGELYDLTAPAFYGLISRIVSDSDAAHDILKDVFIRLWRDAKRIEAGGGSVMVWLTLEARARSVDWQRSRTGLRTTAHSRLLPLLKFHSWIPRPEEIAQIEKRRHLLEKLARRLPEPQSELLELAILKGFTETEIAQQHKQPPGRIEHELRAGLRFLRHRLRAVLGTWTADI
jgi:RNA polymerase sigma-70 factor, ECF subfamily